MHKRFPGLCRFFCFILAVVLCPAASAGPQAGTGNLDWTNDQAMLVFFEAVTTIKKHALDSPGSGEIAARAIKAYMRQHDPYGSYLTRDEYHQWKRARDFRFHGVGMEISERQGRFYCLPAPDSPASEAGLEKGDELVRIDGRPVAGQSLYWAGAHIRGEKNSAVTLTVSRNRVLLEFTLLRKPRTDRSVWLDRAGRLRILRITHFSPHTLSEIKAALNGLDPSANLVLDLRGNAGGDLFSAVDTAGLFLPENSLILYIESSRGRIEYRARGRIWNGAKPAIWQDGFTASAAEVLIAGLTGNQRAISFGSPTHGKAMTQKVVALSDGSALVISRGRLSGPRGRSWQGTGLAPMVRVGQTAASWADITASYF